MVGKLEEAIAKFGGSDEAYKLKLKKHIREGMGYSNYINRIGAETAGAAGIGDIKGLSPAGIKSRISSRFGDQNKDIASLRGMVGAVDTAAENLASKQISDSKAAAAKKETAMGLENNVAFSPKDELDQKILAYMQNPKNDDGSVKSLQQFEAELDAEYGNKFSGSQRLYSTDYVSSHIKERIPTDFIGQEDKYSLMAQGYSAKQAEENVGALKYNQMKPEEQLSWSNAHPKMAARLSAMGNDPQLIKDIGLETDSEGNIVPKKSMKELIDDYPGIDPKVIAEQAKPIFAESVAADIFSNLTGAGDLKEKVTSGKIETSDYVDFLESEDYKSFKIALIPMYGGIFTPAEIDQIIFNSIFTK